jgi:hypothetical protein
MDQAGLLTKTDWGLLIELKEGFIFDMNNFDVTIKALVDSCVEYKKTKILIDATKANPGASVLKMLDVANQFSKSEVRFKMAIIPPKSVNDENSRTMETFSFNRGVFLQYFLDKDAALEWLLK